MMLDKAVEIVKEALKKEYLRNPQTIWDYPCLAIVNKNKELRIIDGKYDEKILANWIRENINLSDVEIIVIGRMLVEYGNIIDPNTNRPIVKKKAIVVYGKNIKNNEVKMITLPCKEHIDLRDLKTIENTPRTTEIINHTLGGTPDIERMLNFNENKQYHFKARFGKEEVISSKNGYKVVEDPLINIILKGGENERS